MLANALKAPDIGEGSACPMPGCKGKFEIEHKHDGGCSCHISAPCSYCTDTYLECSKCGINADTIYDLWAVFQKEVEEERAAEHERETRKNASPFHRTPPSSGVLAANELWLPGVRGHRP